MHSAFAGRAGQRDAEVAAKLMLPVCEIYEPARYC